MSGKTVERLCLEERVLRILKYRFAFNSEEHLQTTAEMLADIALSHLEEQ